MSAKNAGQADPKEVAKHAIGHVLQRIRDDKDVRYRLGAGTQSFGQLTEAYALLTGQAASDVREQFIRGSSCLYQ